MERERQAAQAVLEDRDSRHAAEALSKILTEVVKLPSTKAIEEVL